MNNDTKNECIDSIVRALETTAAWRTKLAGRFPDDARNPRAAKTLTTLANDASSIRDDQWLMLSKHYNWASEQWQAALNDTTKAVGFHIRAGTFDIFLNALLQRLALTESVAA